MRLTLPYLACHAKKYSSAPRGCPTRQKLTQKMQFPIVLPSGSRFFSNGAVMAINGSWNIMPKNATPSRSAQVPPAQYLRELTDEIVGGNPHQHFMQDRRQRKHHAARG